MSIFGRRVLRELSYLRAVEVDDDTDISHHGIKGQKWGVRRYQNPDGSLTQKDYEHDESFGVKTYLAHHGIKGQHWGVRNGPPYPLKPPRTDISDKTYAKINELYRSMPLADRRMIDPDISDEPQDYFKDAKYYHDNTAFNAVSDRGFIIAEKVPSDQNIDGTHGVEIGIGVTEKGRGVGTGLTKDLVDWFDSVDIDDSGVNTFRCQSFRRFVGFAYHDAGGDDCGVLSIADEVAFTKRDFAYNT